MLASDGVSRASSLCASDAEASKSLPSMHEETPSPSAKRAGTEEPGETANPTPGPVTKRRRTGAREKAVQSLAAEAAELGEKAEAMSLRASQAKAAAEEAMRRATVMAKEAAELESQAEAQKLAPDDRSKAERAELETTKEGRAAVKAQDAAEKRTAAEAARMKKLQEKQDAAASRKAIKDMGDAIKSSMVISKRGGMWEVPPGSVSFRNVSFSTFMTLFARGRCSFTPTNYCQNDPTISVYTKDAASIFGSTKVRGGSMYATFVITSMRATFIPAKGSLCISYDTDHGF